MSNNHVFLFETRIREKLMVPGFFISLFQWTTKKDHPKTNGTKSRWRERLPIRGINSKTNRTHAPVLLNILKGK